MLLIKTVGIVLIVAACIFTGFFKSFSVRLRAKKLSAFCDGLILLYEYVEQGNFELDTAFKRAFSKCDFLSFEGTRAVCNDSDLTGEDADIINSFFSSLGASAKKAECDRIKTFNLTIKKRLKEAEDDTAQKSKIYQAFGICIGLTVGILLI